METPKMPAPDADEIDLRAWALALARSWKLIVGLTVLAVMAAGVFTLLQPRLFEATALVVASVPPGEPSGPDPQAVARTAVKVAQSDALIAEVYELVRAELRTIRDRAELKRAMKASAARDPRTVRLVVRTQDPAEAAAIANAWARWVVVRVNDVYIGREVARGIGLDARIGLRFLQAGLGWGGSCFPKDTLALLAMGREYGLRLPIVEAAWEVNARQRERVVEKLLGELKTLKGKTIALLGLSFKPHTDDLRDSPALALARLLLERGAFVRAHDPVALPRARREVGRSLEYAETPEAVLAGADAVVLATDWPEYRTWPWRELRPLLRRALVVDARNHLDGEALARAGYRYLGVGIPDLFPVQEVV